MLTIGECGAQRQHGGAPMNWKTAIGIIISALFLFLAFRNVDFAELGAALKSANYLYIIPVVLLSLVSVSVRSLRWRYLLRPIKEIGARSLLSATFIGLMANNVLPARLGEFVRAYVIGEREQISKSTSFATIVLERILDGFTILFFLVIVLVFYAFAFPGWLRKASYFTLIFYLAAILFLILLRVNTRRAVGIAEFTLRPFPERIRNLAVRVLYAFIEGLAVLHSTRNVMIAGSLSVLVWLPHVLINHLLLASFDIHLSIFASFLLLVALAIGVMVPSAPGFVGTVQYVCVLSLALFGVPREQALSFSIVYHASVFIPVTVVGLAFLFIERLSFTDIRGTVVRADKAGDTEW